MQAKLPVFAVTDRNTDVGKTIADGDFGWWCCSDSVNAFTEIMKIIEKENIEVKGENAYKYLIEHFNTKNAEKKIVETIKA
jgi:glycosyltransferase involved in cell wall biosynthesis